MSGYRDIAGIYDKIMSHVDYSMWADYICSILDKYIGLSDASIFEIGGGTGSLASILRSQNYHVITSDLSAHMLYESRKKGLTSVICTDARALPIKKEFDSVLFLYDGINYLTSLAEYKKIFTEVKRVLKSGGLFIFDITTEKNSIVNFLNSVDFEEFDNATYIRHSYYNKDTRIQHNDFTIFFKESESELYNKRYDFHRQKLFTVAEIISSIDKTDYKVEAVWDDFSHKRYNKNSERIHFVLRRL